MDLRTAEGRRELGQRIQTAVMGADYPSLAAFAEDLGCSRALIYQYVNGETLAQLDRLSRIADLTGRPLEWFFAADPNGVSPDPHTLSDQIEQMRQRCEALERSLARERAARLAEMEGFTDALICAQRQLCLARERAGDPVGALEAATRWAELASSRGDTAARMSAQLHAGRAAAASGSRDRAEEALCEARELASESGDARVEMAARQELIRVRQAAGRIEEAEVEARSLAASDRWWPRWSATVTLAALAEQSGRLQAAEEYLDRAEEIIAQQDAPAENRAIAEVYLLSNRVNLQLARGHYSAAECQSRRLQDRAAAAGLPDQLREAALNRAICSLRGNRLDEAGERLDRVAEWAQMASDRRVEALCEAFEAERLIRCGHLAAAREAALGAVEHARQTINGQALTEAELALGTAYLASGLSQDASYHLRRCARRAERLCLHRLQVAARLALARAEDQPERRQALLDQMRREA
ncbi:MAG: helix-turn-helix domain-containing protein [Armatimonadota bacterium]